MILEGIVTTRNADGGVNVAPMGPRVDAAMTHLLLRPYPTSRTCQNLLAHGQGVFHVTDDVLLLARAAVGDVEAEGVPAAAVDGVVLADACRWYEFRVVAADTSEPRVRLEAAVVHVGLVRGFFGFNRGKHAVVEAAILATRVGILPLAEIVTELDRLEPLVAKTGGDREREAFAFLRAYVEKQRVNVV